MYQTVCYYTYPSLSNLTSQLFLVQKKRDPPTNNVDWGVCQKSGYGRASVTTTVTDLLFVRAWTRRSKGLRMGVV